MPERQLVRLKVPSKRLMPVQQSMDDANNKTQPRTKWTAFEKQEFFERRKKNLHLSIEEFQEKYYPDRPVRALKIMYTRMNKLTRKEANTETEKADPQRPKNPKSTELKRPRYSGPFESGSEIEEENSCSEDRIEDSDCDRRSPKKLTKLSHSAEPRSPLTRYDKERDPRRRPQTEETTGISKEATASSSRPQTTPPETNNVARDKSCPPPSSNSTGMNVKAPESAPSNQSTEYNGPDTQELGINNGSQQQSQLRASGKYESFLESHIRNENKKSREIILEALESIIRREESILIVTGEARAKASSVHNEYETLKRDYESMKKDIDRINSEKGVEMANLQTERDSLKQENEDLKQRLNQIHMRMGSLFHDLFRGENAIPRTKSDGGPISYCTTQLS